MSNDGGQLDETDGEVSSSMNAGGEAVFSRDKK